MKQLIGHIGVDSGLVMIGDPCYANYEDHKDHPIHDWNEFCKSLEFSSGPIMKSLDFTAGHEGLGVIVTSGCGDGMYPVTAETDKDGTITSITIDFLCHVAEPNEYECEPEMLP